jgi:hypothetical protein
VASYGLRGEHLGTVKAPHFLAAVLGKPTEASRGPPWQSSPGRGRKATTISPRFRARFAPRRESRPPWRNTTTGKLQRADGQRFPIGFTRSLVMLDAVILVLAACEYPDKAVRIP